MKKLKQLQSYFKYNPEDILAVSIRQYGQKPVKKMGELTGIRILDGRFRPGSLTNPTQRFFEPSLLVVTDPLADQQALHEAENIGIPVIGLCDTNNETKYLDVIIPTITRVDVHLLLYTGF